MKSTIYYSKRKFTDEYKGGDRKLKFDFTELMLAMKGWV